MSTAKTEAMPATVQPMLAKLVDVLPRDDGGWAYEMKWDGWRAVAFVRDGKLRASTRNGLDLTAKYPELQAIAAQLAGHAAVLDGEIVGFDEHGKPRFEALQQRMGVEGRKRVVARQDVPIAYVIFDLLYLDGRSLMPARYTERREILESLALQGGNWMTPPYASSDGQRMMEVSLQQGFEGVIAKRLASAYEAGKRTGAWLKVKNHMSQEFVIGGWVPGEGRRQGQLGALVIGYYAGGKLMSAGSVGTGFTNRSLEELHKMLQPLARDSSPFTAGELPRATNFVEPRLVCEVEFTEWTSKTAQLRHPSYKGLRIDKDPLEVVREEPS